MAMYIMHNVKAYMWMEACNVWIINACIQGLCVICPEPIQTFHIGLCSLCLMQSEMVNSMEKLCSIAYNFFNYYSFDPCPKWREKFDPIASWLCYNTMLKPCLNLQKNYLKQTPLWNFGIHSFLKVIL